MTWTVLVLVLLLLGGAWASAPTQIEVTVEAPWQPTAVSSEVLEYLHASVSSAAHWQLVERLAAGTPAEDDALVQLAGVDGAELALLRWALTTHHYAAKVEAQRASHRELNAVFSTAPSGLLDVFVASTANEHYVCRVRSAAELASVLQPSSHPAACSGLPVRAAPLQLFPDDQERCWPAANNNNNDKAPTEHTVVVYYHFQPGDDHAEFAAVHRLLVERASSTRYCLRAANDFASRVPGEQPAPNYLRGYEVELALKNLEYKAVNEPSAGEKGSDDTSSEAAALGAGKSADELIAEFESLADAEAALLPEKTVSYVAAAAEPWQALFDVTHDFPLMTSAIVNTSSLAPSQLTNYWCFVRGYDALLLNGRAVRADPFSLLQRMHEELALQRQIDRLPLAADVKAKLLYLQSSSSSSSSPSQLRFELPASAVHWLNDLQQDKQYAEYGWPDRLQTLVASPQQLQPIRKNVLNVVLLLDALDGYGLGMLINLASGLLQGFPVRFGVLVTAPPRDNKAERTQLGADLAATINAVLYSDEPLSVQVRWLMFFMQTIGRDEIGREHVDRLRAGVEQAFGEDELAGGRRRLAEHNAAAAALGFVGETALFLNGVWLKGGAQELMDSAVWNEYRYVHELVQRGVISDASTRSSKAIYQAVLASADALKRRNAALAAQPLRLAADLELADLRALGVHYLRSVDADPDAVATLNYLIVGDLDAPHTAAVALAALANLSTASRSLAAQVRVGVVDTTDGRSRAWRAVAAALRSQRSSSSCLLFVEQLLRDVVAGAAPQLDALAAAHLPRPERYHQTATAAAADIDAAAAAQSRWWRRQPLAAGAGGAVPLLVNGRVFFVPATLSLSAADFNFLDRLEHAERVQKRLLSGDADFVQTLELDASVPVDERTGDYLSDVVAALLALLGQDIVSEPRTLLPPRCAQAAIVRHGDGTAPLQVTWVANPLGVTAPATMAVLRRMLAINAQLAAPVFDVTVALNMPASVEQLRDVPLKKFVRYSLDSDGPVLFDRLPEQRLLTMQVHPPASWLVGSTHAGADLDNIRLAAVAARPLLARHQLEYLLYDGSCVDESSTPPQGLQLTLSSATTGATLSDTIVMQNLGYYQLKALPGLWRLAMAPGRAAQLFRFDGGAEWQTAAIDALVDRQQRRVLRVERRPGFEHESLLSTGDEQLVEAPSSSVWDSLSNMMWHGGETNDKHTIHVFSLASGHLYERFMKIMILSVLEHTTSPVKFWLLSNYLSPGFKKLVPHMAERFGFEFEFVTYQWPHWLRAQTEKQRIMWGYKILFLDVLFPLNLERIIFVDADQIVRADLAELMDMDLHGAPYGYTPFCDSRTEMDGFRFWKQGFWQQHLWGKPYHISALYVVDLGRFRRMGAGDILRSQYEMLSADPNSLANLDQDLPNYLQHYVPIHSLPPDWLWCETWCDDASKQTAKTIDLCNNPLTKTPKLENAVRIVPEWTAYDETARNFEQSLGDLDSLAAPKRQQQLSAI